jgi:hypothetical protein
VCFQHFEGSDRVYAVVCLDVSLGHAPIWLVRIGSTFDRWAVCAHQTAGGPVHSPWAYNGGVLAPSGGAPVTVLRPSRAILAPSARQIAYFSRWKPI